MSTLKEVHDLRAACHEARAALNARADSLANGRPYDEVPMRDAASMMGRAETALDQPGGPQPAAARTQLQNADGMLNGLARDAQNREMLEVISNLISRTISLEERLELEATQFKQLLNLAVDATQSAQRIADADGSPEEAASHAEQATELRKQLDQLTSGSCRRDVLNLRAREALEAAVAHPAGRKINFKGSVSPAQERGMDRLRAV